MNLLRSWFLSNPTNRGIQRRYDWTSSTTGFILIGIVVAVVVLSGRGGDDDDDDYVEDDDFLPQGEAVEPLKSRGPPSRGPPSRGPPTPQLTEMELALQEFPFWDENTIQGYFDMGWSIDQLRDWLAEQNQ